MQVAGSLSHTVVLAADRDVDALFLLDENKPFNPKHDNENKTHCSSFVREARRAHLQSLRHDAAHHSTHPKRALHVQFTEGRLELVDGNQPGSDSRRCCAEQVQLAKHTKIKQLLINKFIFICL